MGFLCLSGKCRELHERLKYVPRGTEFLTALLGSLLLGRLALETQPVSPPWALQRDEVLPVRCPGVERAFGD